MKKAKKKIIVDLDAVTVSNWDKSENGDLGRKFLLRVKHKEFSMLTSFYLLGHLRNKEKQINELFKKNGLKTIGIVGPEEV